MKRRPIGYYVHHQGAGHLHRARLIAAALPRPCTLIGTSVENVGDQTVLSLADDRMDESFAGADGMAHRPEAFHYAPIGHAGVSSRMAAIAAWIAANDPVLMIVDVSVEVALFARLMSVPVLLVRLAGRRDDQPHLEAFRAAETLIAPFPAVFDCAAMPDWVKDKTIHVGFLSADTGRATTDGTAREIAVVLGRGGSPMDPALLTEAAVSTPDWTWRVYGDVAAGQHPLPVNLHLAGWVDDIGAALDRAHIVVGGAGDGLIAALVAQGKRFVCLPEPRAFDEQVEKAKVFDQRGLAIVLPQWPRAKDWPDILRRASALDPACLQALHDPYVVTKAASAIEAIAARLDR